MDATAASHAALSLVVNGEHRRLALEPGRSDRPTVAGLLEVLGLAGRRVAVAVNRSVVPRSHHASHVLADGDRVEILEAVGGG